MEEQEFITIATEYLEDLAEKIENADLKYALDVECSDGVLQISSDKGVYVVNRHVPSVQIWLSSPFSGANYFTIQGGKWLSKNDENLEVTLRNELEVNFGVRY
jgi:iron donor protein CyaY